MRTLMTPPPRSTGNLIPARRIAGGTYSDDAGPLRRFGARTRTLADGVELPPTTKGR